MRKMAAMEPLQVLVFTLHQGTDRLATSALPDAPVVRDEPARPRLATSRRALARGLRTVAARVEPREARPARA
jgi:hypothetical protein